jgi:hypothetical protein
MGYGKQAVSSILERHLLGPIFIIYSHLRIELPSGLFQVPTILMHLLSLRCVL